MRYSSSPGASCYLFQKLLHLCYVVSSFLCTMMALLYAFMNYENRVVSMYHYVSQCLVKLASSIFFALSLQGIRDATHDLLHILVAVHAEVTSISSYSDLMFFSRHH
jgi:hypothetical protein